MIGPTDLHPSPAPHFKTFQAFLICYPEQPSIYIYNLLHKYQLHVSARDNGHLQVEIEKLSKQLYSTSVGSVQRAGKR